MSTFSDSLFPQTFTPELEREFLRDYCERFVVQRRFAAILGAILIIVYCIYDAYDVIARAQFDRRAQITMLWRFISLFFELTAAALVFLPRAKTHEHFASGCCIAAVTLCFFRNLLCAYYADVQYYYLYYYDGMLLTVLVFIGLFRVRTMLTIVTITLLVMATAYCSFLSEQQAKGYPSILSSLIVFSLVGCVVTLGFERSARTNFLREQELRQARSEIARNADQLMILKDQAQQQNRDKSKFLADAAHDVRNVMQPVSLFLDASDLALTQGDLTSAQKNLKDAIFANSAMRVTINALLDISGLESGRITIRASHFDLNRLAEEVLADYQPFATRLMVKLYQSKRRSHRVIVYSDRQHLKRILSNLVSNGIKYADHAKKSGPWVVLAMVSHQNLVRIDVLDNGIGIPLEEQGNVFKPLYQLNNPERNREKGVGLGLSIVNSTLKLLPDHAYKFKSIPGDGTRFSLHLPKGELSVVEQLPVLNVDDCCLKGLYVWVMENDALVKNAITTLLYNNGALYEAFSSLAELQAQLPALERQPDVLVSDYRLADQVTAVEVIDTLVSYYGHDFPVLIVTGEIADLSSVLPARRVLRKPLEPKQLLAEIADLGCDG